MAKVNEGVAPYQSNTDVGDVRVLIQDTDATDISDGTGSYMWVGDAEIEDYIRLKGSVNRAAISILRMVAITPAMQYKKWSSADLSVDGAAITRALREMIRDIEDGMNADDEVAASEFVMVAPVGPAMAQPALFPECVPEINGQPLDPTLPYRVV
jgi:hypothetical protein